MSTLYDILSGERKPILGGGFNIRFGGGGTELVPTGFMNQLEELRQLYQVIGQRNDPALSQRAPVSKTKRTGYVSY